MLHTIEQTLNKKCVLVLGGNGFIGKNIVSLLKRNGVDVLVGSRAKNRDLQPYERRVILHQMLLTDNWLKLLKEVDVIVNAVGILRPRKDESYEAVHHLAVKSLVQACAKHKRKLIHISALGLEHDLSDAFSVTKKQGESVLINSHADWHIVRASLVEGEGAYGGTWFKKMARLPIHFIPEKHGYISPVDVSVIAKKVEILVNKKANEKQRIHEVSNGKHFLLPDYLVALNDGIKRPRIVVPDIIVRMAARVCDAFGVTPFTFGHYELLTFDNCPAGSKLTNVQSETDWTKEKYRI